MPLNPSHLLGPGGARDLKNGKVGSDANGTTAVQYMDSTFGLGGLGSGNADNDYVEFFPLYDHDYQVSWVMLSDDNPIAKSTYTAEVEVYNNGPNSETDVPVRLFANGAQSGAEVLVSLAPGEADTVQFTFTPLSDGAYELKATSFLATDQNIANNSAITNVTVWPFGTTFQNYFITSGIIDKPISNTFTTYDTLTLVTDAPTAIVDIEVIIDSLTHTWDSDIDMYLIGPNGVPLELSTDNGGSSDNYIGTIFDDQAELSITQGSAPFTGF